MCTDQLIKQHEIKVSAYLATLEKNHSTLVPQLRLSIIHTMHNANTIFVAMVEHWMYFWSEVLIRLAVDPSVPPP